MCINRGGFLATPDNQEKNDFLKRKLLSVSPRLFVWFGADRQHWTRWMMGGQPIKFTDWAAGICTARKPSKQGFIFMPCSSQ